MRTLHEIQEDIVRATANSDATALFALADEFDTHENSVAAAAAHAARGQACRMEGRFAESLEHYTHALSLHERHNNPSAVAAVTGNIGNVQRATGNYPAALESYHKALALHEQCGDQQSVAVVIGNIGNVYGSVGKCDTAIEYFHRSMAIHEQYGDIRSVARRMGNIGQAYLQMREYDKALEFLKRALTVHESTGNVYEADIVNCNIVQTLIELGEVEEAYSVLRRTEDREGLTPSVRLTLQLLQASMLAGAGQHEKAFEILVEGVDIAKRYNIVDQQAEAERQLREVCRARGDLEGYIAHNAEFVRITEEINGKETAARLATQEKQQELDAIQRDHQRNLAVLHSTLPKHVADRVAKGESVNDTFENAAVLFLDIVAFTSHTSSLDATGVVELLQGIFPAFDAICSQYDVVKIKTIGDSYMVVSFPSAGHCVRMAETALAMQSVELYWPATKDAVQFRVGIHCGPVVAGVIGTNRLQYDVWGDTVNVASRMESTCEPSKIQVSAAFAQMLREAGGHNQFRLEERGDVDIKGKGLMQTYWLMS